MNEVITRLNEIEEKAQAILSDTKDRKEEMLRQLELDKKELAGRYQTLERQKAAALRERLAAETDERLSGVKREYEEAARQMEEEFERKKEALAEEVFQRIIKD